MPVLLAEADIRRVLPVDALLLLPPIAGATDPSAALPARDPERDVCDEQDEDLPERPAAVSPEHRLRVCSERAVSTIEERAVPRDGGRTRVPPQDRLPREVEPRVEIREGGGVNSRVCKQDGKCDARAREQENDGRDVLRAVPSPLDKSLSVVQPPKTLVPHYTRLLDIQLGLDLGVFLLPRSCRRRQAFPFHPESLLTL